MAKAELVPWVAATTNTIAITTAGSNTSWPLSAEWRGAATQPVVVQTAVQIIPPREQTPLEWLASEVESVCALARG